VREEFGVNQFTTPSIRKLFDMLNNVGKLRYDDLKRPFTDKTPADRIIVSMGLGTLIADGFLIVQCEKVEEMESVGRAMIKYGKALGAGNRMNKHSRACLSTASRATGRTSASSSPKRRRMSRRKWSCCGMWTSRISSASAAGCVRWRSPPRASATTTPRKRPASSPAVTSPSTTS
jgi:hypothetical protein